MEKAGQDCVEINIESFTSCTVPESCHMVLRGDDRANSSIGQKRLSAKVCYGALTSSRCAMVANVRQAFAREFLWPIVPGRRRCNCLRANSFALGNVNVSDTWSFDARRFRAGHATLESPVSRLRRVKGLSL